jgi:hypothetical protein
LNYSGAGICLERGAASVLAAADALPSAEDLMTELECVSSASARGYFLPDEEECIRIRYSQFLSLRVALLDVLDELGEMAGRGEVEWRDRLPVFMTAFAAACVLSRADRFLIDLAEERPVVWKKLDEADVRAGIPRKSFSGVYKAVSDPMNAQRFLAAADFYFRNRGEIQELADEWGLRAVVDLLVNEEGLIERRRRDALGRFVSYRWYSFLRRHRSAWKKVMFGLFEVSGRAVADLRQPGIRQTGAPKRVTAELREAVLAQARPGDVFVTRHDDALSNWFLPGFWPHAALYLGNQDEAGKLGIKLPGPGGWFLEAKKDGVRIRPANETLQVDAFVVLRPPLIGEDLRGALLRALSHEGKPYDFVFDFRTADRLVCTEVVYRGFHGSGPMRFRLKEVGGRLCLPAEELLDQGLENGFQIAAVGGVSGEGLLVGMDADLAIRKTRNPSSSESMRGTSQNQSMRQR